MTIEERIKKAAYMRAYRIKNPEIVRRAERATKLRHHEKVLARKKEYRGRNKEQIREYNRVYMTSNPDLMRTWRTKWEIKNPSSLAERKAKRRARELAAMPPWIDHAAIKAIYADCVRRTRETGIQHHVDHIIPLQGKTVSGLHVPWNLQVIPAIENLHKSNKLEWGP